MTNNTDETDHGCSKGKLSEAVSDVTREKTYQDIDTEWQKRIETLMIDEFVGMSREDFRAFYLEA